MELNNKVKSLILFLWLPFILGCAYSQERARMDSMRTFLIGTLNDPNVSEERKQQTIQSLENLRKREMQIEYEAYLNRLYWANALGQAGQATSNAWKEKMRQDQLENMRRQELLENYQESWERQRIINSLEDINRTLRGW